MPSASQATRGDETVTERTTCSWAVRRVGCAGRLCSKVGANYCVLLFMFFILSRNFRVADLPEVSGVKLPLFGETSIKTSMKLHSPARNTARRRGVRLTATPFILQKTR